VRRFLYTLVRPDLWLPGLAELAGDVLTWAGAYDAAGRCYDWAERRLRG
jgi:hypothetical protein